LGLSWLSYLESEKVVGKIYFNIYYSFRNKTVDIDSS